MPPAAAPKHLTIPQSRRSEEDNYHVEYLLELDGIPCGWRRYSEFDELRSYFSQHDSAIAFPPKRMFNTSQVQQERRIGLELWLGHLLSLVNPEENVVGANILRAFCNSEPWTWTSRAAAAATTTSIASRVDASISNSEAAEASVPAPPPPMIQTDWNRIDQELNDILERFLGQGNVSETELEEEEDESEEAFEARVKEAEALYV